MAQRFDEKKFRELNALTEEELRKKASDKFKEEGTLAQTLQIIQEWSEADSKLALITYLMTDTKPSAHER